MTIALYMDVYVRRAITNGLKLRGIDVITVGECVRDLEIIAQASEPEDLVNQVQYLPL